MKKRGLSDLIATVLIVLLALAAVAIVWSFLRPPLENTGTSISLGTKCIESEMKPISCSRVGASTTVKVQHTKGESAMRAIVSIDYEGDVSNYTRSGDIPLFSTVDVVVPYAGGALDAETASVVAIVSDDIGNEDICEESVITIPCTNA